MDYISKESATSIIELLTKCFQLNSHADNIAYFLSSRDLIKVEEIYHSKWAHYFPQLADEISNRLIAWGIKPMRGALDGNIEDYDNIEVAFSDSEMAFLSFIKAIENSIEVADMSNSPKSRIFLENLLDVLTPFVHQARIWTNKAHDLVNDENRFNNCFEEFTII
jgi:hypothetical protein